MKIINHYSDLIFFAHTQHVICLILSSNYILLVVSLDNSIRRHIYIQGSQKVTDGLKNLITFVSKNFSFTFFQNISNYPSNISVSSYSKKEGTLIIQWYLSHISQIQKPRECYRQHINTRNSIQELIYHF